MLLQVKECSHANIAIDDFLAITSGHISADCLPQVQSYQFTASLPSRVLKLTAKKPYLSTIFALGFRSDQ